MTVEVKVGTEQLRVINGYGPQESEDSIANDLNINVIIKIGANAKLGSDIIKGCPHKMSNNGKLLYDIIERQDLIVVLLKYVWKQLKEKEYFKIRLKNL